MTEIKEKKELESKPVFTLPELPSMGLNIIKRSDGGVISETLLQARAVTIQDAASAIDHLLQVSDYIQNKESVKNGDKKKQTQSLYG